MTNVPANLIPQATEILLPQIATADEREAWLTQAFYITERRLYSQIDRSGAPIIFATRCIKTLLDFGCLPDGRHALSILLDALRLAYGSDKYPQIEALTQSVDLLCAADEAPTPTSQIGAAVRPTLPIQTLQTPPAQRTPTVFISYARTDAEFVERLMADLQAAGHACWIDTTDIKGGDEWVRAITEGINNSYVFLSIVTPAGNDSRWVRREFLWAEDKRKLVLPVLAADAGLPIYMVDLHAIRLHPDYQDGLEKLLSTLPKPTIAQPADDDIDERAGRNRAKTKLRRGIEEEEESQLPAPTQRALELEYLDRLRLEELLNTEKYTPMAGTAQVSHAVPPTTSVQPVTIRPEFEHLRQLSGREQEKETETRKFEDIITAIAEIRRAVVLGEPGSGKTTTLWKLAKNMLDVALDDPATPIPVLVRLSKWTDPDQSLRNFVAGEMGDLGAHLDNLMSEKRAALLLDGLNEVPVGQRADKAQQIKTLVDAHPDLISVMTCREQDYTLDLGFDRIAITPLDPIRIREFVKRYLGDTQGDTLFWRLAGEEARTTIDRFRKEIADQLTDPEAVFWLAATPPDGVQWGWKNNRWKRWLEVRDDPNSLMTLSRNPYMLLMMTEVFAQTGQLPDNRGQLFRSFVETLLRREGITKQAEDLVRSLSMLAYMMQFRRMMQTLNTEEMQLIEESAVTAAPREAVAQFLSEEMLYLASSASILVVSDVVRFSHQLLQEYFLAYIMRSQIAEVKLKAESIWMSERWWKRTGWEEATVILAGLYHDDSTPVLNWIADANPEVAAQCVLRSGAHTPPATLEKFRTDWIPRLTDLEREPKPEARAAVGRALGLLKLDNRPGVGLRPDGVPDIAWCEVPDGEFFYQKDERVTLELFLIAKYPITYSQFQAFIDAEDGYDNLEWWEGLSRRQSEPSDQAFQFANNPRDRVSWYEAVAFCRWLSAKLRSEIRLPTEQEWEKAARGTDGRAYPWGNDFDPQRANTREASLGMTVAVGIFPHGVSPYGVLDMIGNVVEWTYTDYDTRLDGVSHPKGFSPKNLSARGGSWFRDQSKAGASTRSGLYGNDRYSSLGFRVVCIPTKL